MHDRGHVGREAHRSALAGQAFSLAVLAALAGQAVGVAACSSSSGPSSFGLPAEAGGSGSSSGAVSISSTPICPGCGTADGSVNTIGVPMCPTGWMVTPSCKCYLPDLACNDANNDCQGITSVCLPEPNLNGAGNRCHCSCPPLVGNGC